VAQDDLLPLHDESNSHIVRLLSSRAFIHQVVAAKLFSSSVVEAVASASHCERPDVLAFHVLRPTPSNPQWVSSPCSICLPNLLDKMASKIWQQHVIVCSRPACSNQLTISSGSIQIEPSLIAHHHRSDTTQTHGRLQLQLVAKRSEAHSQFYNTALRCRARVGTRSATQNERSAMITK
jgi:hypothetical protein